MTFDKTTPRLNFKDQSIAETSFVVQRASTDGGSLGDVDTIQVAARPAEHPSGPVVGPDRVRPVTDYQFRVKANNTVGALDSAVTGYAGITVFSLSTDGASRR